MDSVRVVKNGWVVVLSMLLPGLGHWLVGRWDKAIFIISSFLFHLSLAYTLLHMVVIEQPVTVAYIMLAIPYHYFYGIFNSLQSMHARFHYISQQIVALAGLVFLTALLLCLPIDWLYPFKQLICRLYPVVLLFSTAVYFLLHLRKRSNGKLYIFRISASLSLLLFIVLLLLQRYIPIQWSNWLLALPIILVIELLCLLFYRYYRQLSLGYRVDGGSVLISAVVIVGAYFVLQYSDYPAKLLESFHAPVIAEEQLDGEVGFVYELAPIKVSTVDNYAALQLRHLNGYVSISIGDVDELTIYPKLFVATEDEQVALSVKEQSKVEVMFDEKLSIVTSLPSYSLNHYPRMNLNIVLPKQKRFLERADIRVEHGTISIRQLVFFDTLKVESNTGSINVRNVIGAIEAGSRSGSIYMSKIVGKITVQTKKGDISLTDPSRDITATTLNGDISVQTKLLKGDWNLTATVGNIQLKLPQAADYELNAKVSFGQIIGSDLLQQRLKELSYTQGVGGRVINLYASNYILLR